MSRFLIRGSINPLKPATTNQMLLHDHVGGNSGNMLYLVGVMRSIWTEETDVDVDYYAFENGRYSNTDIDYVNSYYDAYLIPLADAFREDYKRNWIILHGLLII